MTNKRTFFGCVLIAATLWTQPLTARAENSAALMDRLRKAADSNSLDSASMSPWHLKLSFQLNDEKGAPAEKGTIEEWWFDSTNSKIVYTSPSYTATEIKAEDGLYRTKGMSLPPEGFQLMLQQVVHPINFGLTPGDLTAQKETQIFGKTAVECIMPYNKGKETPLLGTAPTYCFEPNKDVLLATLGYTVQTIMRPNVGSFQQKTIVIDQTVGRNKVVRMTAHTDSLQAILGPHGVFAPSGDLELVRPTATADPLVSGFKKVHTVPPIYPPSSRQTHTSGTVLLSAIIGKDGRMLKVDVLSTPDKNLGDAALTAVQQWVYEPYLVSGQPVEVQIRIVINFNSHCFNSGLITHLHNQTHKEKS